MVRLGFHVSIAGKIYESLERAHAIGCTAMQIFSRNPRGWALAPLDTHDAKRFRELKKQYDITPVVVHIPYLINLASPDEILYKRSIAAYEADLRRSDELGAEYFVTHLGSHVGTGEAAGMRRFSQAIDGIMKRVRPQTTILLETTAGSGSWLGYRFEQIRQIIDGIDDGDRIGVCFDTAHVFAAGYDLKTASGLTATLKAFDRILGIGRIRVVHFNDSRATYASHVDRHDHIGKGELGSAALGRIINHPLLAHAAFIMETPKESEKDDLRNLVAVKKLIKKKKAS